MSESQEPSAGIGNEDDNLIIVNPGTITGDAAGSGDSISDSGTGRRRGRKPGSRNKPKEDGSATLKGVEIAPILVSIHALLSARMGEHWRLDDDESKQLEKAIKNALRHQDMRVTQKQLDYAMLAYVVAQIYGTRVVTSITLARMQPGQTPPNNVTHFGVRS